MFTVNGVILPDPELGDTSGHNYKVKTKRTRSGNIHTSVKSPIGETFTYTFLNVPTHVRDDLEVAIDVNPDLTVDIFDHHDRNFTAQVTNYSSQVQSRHEDNTINLTIRRTT